MAARIFSDLREFTFSGLDQPTNQADITSNSLRASFWGTIGSGGTALVAFIFSRYLIQNEPWKSNAPHVVMATVWSCGMFAAVAAYIIYRANPEAGDDSRKLINTGVSLIAKGSAMVGLIGAAAAALATHYVKESSLAKHSLVPLLGLGTAGSILWIFTNWQNKQLDAFNRKGFRLEGII